MIRLKCLTKSFGDRNLYNNFSLSLPDKGLVCIVGESGSGKSTLLNMISGIDNDYKGTIEIDDINIKNLKGDKLSDFRLKNIGYVFQNFNLLNLATAYQNIMIPLNSISFSSSRIRNKRCFDIMKKLGILKLKNTNVNKLSGGEKQRVAISRALINEPKVILCDEPTGALDEKNSHEIFDLLKMISSNTLVVIATHDLVSAKQYSDIIVSILDSRIDIIYQKMRNQKDTPLFMGIGNKIKKPHLPLSFKVAHSIQKNKSKKWRSLIMNAMLSLSLTGVGLSILIKDSVSQKINESFAEIINGNQIVMTAKNQNPNGFSASYNASSEKILNIYENYNDYFDGIGVNYLVNFEDFFKDNNTITAYGENKRFELTTFSVRSINEFVSLNNSNQTVFYPFEPSEMEDDQVVLGLPYEVMVNLCFSLKITRNYTSLGHYINEKELMIVLDVKNDSWQYDDQQIFKVVAVCESSKSLIYHTNNLWNEVVFEEMMRFPNDDDDEHYYPWEMQKICYLKTKEDPGKFLNVAMYDAGLSDIIFERTNKKYNPLLCSSSEACSEKMLFVYCVDKYGVNPIDVKEILENNEVSNFYFTSNFGYASFGSSLLSGFSKNVFVSLSDELIDQAIDADTSIDSSNNLVINLPNKVVQGNYVNALSNGLRFSSKPGSLLGGRLPKNLNEIVISKGLAQTLADNENPIGRYLKFAGVISETLDENQRIKKEYGRTQALIVGIADENKNYLYHDSNWTISFFRDKLGVSGFLLIPNGAVFELENNVNSDELLNKFEAQNSYYDFVSPLALINENLSSTLDYANTILISFSILSIVISTLLLSTILMLNIIESKDEIRLFRFLGIKEKDINSTFVCGGVLQGVIAYIISSLELIIVDQIIGFALNDYLNTSYNFTFNFKAILITLFIAIVLPYFISKVMIKLLQRFSKIM